MSDDGGEGEEKTGAIDTTCRPSDDLATLHADDELDVCAPAIPTRPCIFALSASDP